MLKRITMCLLAIVMVLSLVACGSSESKDDNSSTPTPEDLGLQPTNTNYTRDFDTATNQTISFRDITFQIPKDWSVVDEEDGAMYIQGKEESQLGWMCIELLAENVRENDLAGEALQAEIINAYSQTFGEVFDSFEVTNASYDSQSQLFFGNYEGSINGVTASFGICSFVVNGSLFNYVIPFADGDNYKYSLDVQEVVKSVSSLGTGSNDDEIDFSSVEVVSYDSIIAGKHSGKIVGLEAVIGTCEYYELLESYWFDLWYWSDQKQEYVNDEGFVINTDDGYSDLAIEPLRIFDCGDKIKMILEVEKDNSFAPSTHCIWFSLIGKGDLEDYDLPEESESDNEKDIGAGDSDISDIAVRFETDYIDGDRLHITVFTKNNSEEVFAGNVYVTFYSADGKERLGSDTIIVDELLPGRESWADIIVDAYRGTPKMTVDFSEVSFTPIKEVVSEIDLDSTEKTKSSYYWNFDGVSWYNDITDIAVYENGTCVVVLKDNPKEGGQFYASTIWSCGNDHGVDTVQVVDAKGTIIAVYGNGEMVSVSVSNGEIVSESNISTEVQGTEPIENQTTSCSHSWNNGETTKKATCSETGIKTYTCLKCSEKKTETIPKTDHTYDAGKVSKNPTCTDVGKITYTCSACKAQYSEDVEKIAHTWDNGKVKNAATCTLEGSMEYHCTSCGTTKTESIPLIHHIFTEQIVDDKYLCENATFTTGTKYYYSCFCGAKGSETFSLDNRRTWISWHEIVTDYDYTISYLDNDMSEKPHIKIWNKQIQFIIDNVPRRFDITTEDVYIGNCNGCSIQFKYDETQYNIRYSNQDCYFFYYDDLVAAGII